MVDVGHGSRLPRNAVVHGYRGAVVARREMEWIQSHVDEHPWLTRRELAVAVCKRYGWRSPGGAFAIDSVRLLLERWAKRGWLRLPPPRRSRAERRSPRVWSDEELRGGWQPSASAANGRITLRPISDEERPRWRALMQRHHYLGDGGDVGETLRYVGLVGDEPVALLCWAAAALHNGPRDRYLGWDRQTRARRLHLVVNNVRFLMLPWAGKLSRASQVLATNLRRLSRDWQERYGHPVLLAETFVDRSRFRGTCYRASNWMEVGQTLGFTRCGAHYQANGRPKTVFVYPLHQRAREWLCARDSPMDRCCRKEQGKMVEVERLPLAGRGGLFDLLAQMSDWRKRRGIRHSLQSILAVAACAVLAGMKSLAAITQWAREQNEQTLRPLGCRRGRAPSEATFRRVLGKLDMGEFDRKIGRWFVEQQTLAGQGVAIDGKALRGSGDGEAPPVHLVSAVSHNERTVLGQERVAEKSNEINAARPLLDPLPMKGAVVTGDAMFAQKKIVQHIVKEKKADYLFVVKDNQPTLREDIEFLFKEKERQAQERKQAQSLGDEAFPPRAPDNR